MYNILDLFCGAGGLSLGFKKAGYNILLGVDNNEDALKTYKHNLKTNILNTDLSDSKKAVKEMNDHLEEDVDVIIAGPPCQGFSLAGCRNLHDKRNKLYLTVIEAVKQFKPSVLLIENVPGIATLEKGEVLRQIVKTIKDVGYDVYYTHKPLYAVDYGVPQIRKRMFFVGVRKDLNKTNFEFPTPILSENEYVTCSDALSELPPLDNILGTNEAEYTAPPESDYQRLMRKNSTILYNHVAKNHTDKTRYLISLVPDGGNKKDLPEEIRKQYSFRESFVRRNSKKPSMTVDTDHGKHFHYKYNRCTTVRENARLQSFPDDFVFMGCKTQQYVQVGNAVPPLLSYHIAKQIKKYLDNL